MAKLINGRALLRKVLKLLLMVPGYLVNETNAVFDETEYSEIIARKG